jgi:hypothetical protein
LIDPATDVPAFKYKIVALNIADVFQRTLEDFVEWIAAGCWSEVSKSIYLPRLLSLSSARRKREADSEHDREPDQPLGHLVTRPPSCIFPPD